MRFRFVSPAMLIRPSLDRVRGPPTVLITPIAAGEQTAGGARIIKRPVRWENLTIPEQAARFPGAATRH